jgi:hypothetical protein
VVIYEGKPGAACGVAADASSYFDRLWRRDNKAERYFLVLARGQGPAAPAGCHPPAAAAGKKAATRDPAPSSSSSSSSSDAAAAAALAAAAASAAPAASLQLRMGASLTQADPSSVEERVKKGGYAAQALKAAAFLQSGKSNNKIKFDE